MEDIFVYAKGRVDNKSIAARIGHSAKLHSVRSALSSKGSAASKGLSFAGVVVRATFAAIPLPAVGSLLAAVQSSVETKLRGMHHSRKLAQAKGKDKAEEVKFQLKDLSLEEMDRFRWKVAESITEFNKVKNGFAASVNKKAAAHATCDAFLELALAAEQVSRRIFRLKEKCLAVNTVMDLTMDWVNEVENGTASAGSRPSTSQSAGAASGGVNGVKNQIAKMMSDYINEELSAADAEAALVSDANKAEEAKAAFILQRHGNCGDWCCFRDAGTPDNFKAFKDNAALVVKFLAEPFGPDDFNNNLGSLW
jgi:hypothetical protein